MILFCILVTRHERVFNIVCLEKTVLPVKL